MVIAVEHPPSPGLSADVGDDVGVSMSRSEVVFGYPNVLEEFASDGSEPVRRTGEKESFPVDSNGKKELSSKKKEEEEEKGERTKLFDQFERRRILA